MSNILKIFIYAIKFRIYADRLHCASISQSLSNQAFLFTVYNHIEFDAVDNIVLFVLKGFFC